MQENKNRHFTCIFAVFSCLADLAEKQFTWGGEQSLKSTKNGPIPWFLQCILYFSKTQKKAISSSRSCTQGGAMSLSRAPGGPKNHQRSLGRTPKNMKNWWFRHDFQKKSKIWKMREQQKHCKIQGFGAQGTSTSEKICIFTWVFQGNWGDCIQGTWGKRVLGSWEPEISVSIRRGECVCEDFSVVAV